MLDIIWDNLVKYYPQYIGYFIVILVVGYVVFKCTTFWHKTNKIHNGFEGITASLLKIDSGLNTLNKILLEKNVISQSCYSNGNSPRIINEQGKDVYTVSGGESLMSNIKDSLLEELEKRNPSTALDAERSALEVMLSKMEEPEFNEIQRFAYNNPNYKGTPLTYIDILFVMSLVLRDAYLKKYPNIV